TTRQRGPTYTHTFFCRMCRLEFLTEKNARMHMRRKHRCAQVDVIDGGILTSEGKRNELAGRWNRVNRIARYKVDAGMVSNVVAHVSGVKGRCMAFVFVSSECQNTCTLGAYEKSLLYRYITGAKQSLDGELDESVVVAEFNEVAG